jgi:hypothetical protein
MVTFWFVREQIFASGHFGPDRLGAIHAREMVEPKPKRRGRLPKAKGATAREEVGQLASLAWGDVRAAACSSMRGAACMHEAEHKIQRSLRFDSQVPQAEPADTSQEVRAALQILVGYMQ